MYLHDLHASILAAAGLAPAEDTLSFVLQCYLGDEPTEPARLTLLTSQHQNQSVTDGKGTLIRHADVESTQLFELERDPHGWHDDYHEPEDIAHMLRLEAQLNRLQAKLSDRLP